MLSFAWRWFSRLRRPSDLRFLFGRFYLVRRIFTAYVRTAQKLGRKPDSLSTRLDRPLFPDHMVPRAVAEIHVRSFCGGFDIPGDLVAEIHEFAKTERCFRPGHEGETFLFEEVQGGRTPNGKLVALAQVLDPLRCPAILTVAQDPVLRSVVRGYLGYEPVRVAPILYWSPVSRLDPSHRRSLNQTIDFHYDVDSWNFLYAHFYITHTDEMSGAHVLIPGTHRKKPLRMLLGPTRASLDDIEQLYGAGSAIIIEGPAGTGFVEDTSCFHRALPPIQSDRLLLQIRFN